MITFDFIKIFFFQVVLISHIHGEEIVFLPTEYSSIEPFLFDTNSRNVNMEISLCSSDIYLGCDFDAFINLPFTEWSIPDGTYVNYTIVGGSNCGTTLCTNNPTGSNPFLCHFKLSKLDSPKLYMIALSGRSAGFQATFNLRIKCPNSNINKKEDKIEISGTPSDESITCPGTFQNSQRIVRVVESHSVKTSPKTIFSNKYSFIVCPDTTTFAGIDYVAQASNYVSAMATYFCNIKECNTNNSPTGWYDDSGTAINNVQISNLKSQQIWFNVYGWGQYMGNNTYTFAINIRNG